MNPKPPNLTQRVLKGSGTVMVFTLLSAPFGYLVRVLYSRSLSIEMFGLFYAVLGLFNILVKYNGLGFGYSVVYLVPKYIKQKKLSEAWRSFKYYQIIEIATSLFIALILLLTANWLSTYYFKTPYAKNIIYVFLVYLLSDGLLASLNTFLTGLQMAVYYSSIKLVRQALILGFSFLLIFFDKPSVVGYAIAWSAACILTTIIYYILFYVKHNKYVQKLEWDRKQFKTMAKFAFPSLMTISVTTLISQSDVILLTLIKGVREVGIYNIILPIVTIPSIFLSSINKLIFPLVSDLMTNQRKKVTTLLNSITKIVPFVGLYFAIFILSFPSASIINLFGKRWVELAKTPLIILTIGYTASLLTTYLSTITAAMGKINQKLKVSIVIAISNLLFGGTMIYFFGLIGLVIANSIVYLLSATIYSVIIRREIVFSYPWRYYLKVVTLGVVIYVFIKLLNLNPVGWFQFILYGATYTLVFGLFGYFIGVIDKSVLKEMKAVIGRRSN